MSLVSVITGHGGEMQSARRCLGWLVVVVVVVLVVVVVVVVVVLLVVVVA